MKKFIAVILLFIMSMSIYVDAAVYRCDACPEGYYCPDGGEQYQCGAGTYSHMGASSCTECPYGEYQPNAGQSDCLTCYDQIEYCEYKKCWTEKEKGTGYYACVGACVGLAVLCSCDWAKDKVTKCSTTGGHQTVYYTSNSDRTACVVSSRDTCIEGVWDPK